MDLSEKKNTLSAPHKVALRGVLGGVLMGLANLVPGISGGTMLLAAGVYPQFINGIAEVTTLRLRKASLILLAAVVISAALAILLLAGTVKELVVHHRWIMYSLFIGLTLGGVPVVWNMIQRLTVGVWVGAGAGFIAMATLAVLQSSTSTATTAGVSGWAMLFVAGIAGASAMILPGVSGGYLLLVLGQYVPILSGIDQFKEALKAFDVGGMLGVGLTLVLPVALGVIAGVVGVSNLLRWLLKNAQNATLGVLLGLLVGAVVGLWPFQKGVEPEIGDVFKGSVLTEETLAQVDPEDYPTVRFNPSAAQAAGAAGLVVIGFACTSLVARFGSDRRTEAKG